MGGVAEKQRCVSRGKLDARSADAPATPTHRLLPVYRSWRTVTCGMLAIKPSNKPLHLTAARSLARRPSRLARRGTASAALSANGGARTGERPWGWVDVRSSREGGFGATVSSRAYRARRLA